MKYPLFQLIDDLTSAVQCTFLCEEVFPGNSVAYQTIFFLSPRVKIQKVGNANLPRIKSVWLAKLMPTLTSMTAPITKASKIFLQLQGTSQHISQIFSARSIYFPEATKTDVGCTKIKQANINQGIGIWRLMEVLDNTEKRLAN